MEEVETYKDPSEYLPETFGLAIHFITKEEGVEIYEFDFLNAEGISLW